MILKRDDTFRVVFNLRTQLAPDKVSVGTGAFVCNSKQDMFMVTATHVAKTSNKATDVVISDNDGTATTLKLTDFNQKSEWRHHPVADVSVLPINMTASLTTHLQKRFMPFDHSIVNLR